jgi:deoxyribodipyrimidine photo-lyase
MNLVWLHGGSLSVTDPALQDNPDSPAIFVFDKPFLEQTKIAFPRLQFMFEGALEAFATRAKTRICVGIQAEEILAFAKLHNCTQIHTTEIFSPELDKTLDALEAAGLRVIVYPPERLTSYSGRVKRFSAYWRSVEKEVLHG